MTHLLTKRRKNVKKKLKNKKIFKKNTSIIIQLTPNLTPFINGYYSRRKYYYFSGYAKC